MAPTFFNARIPLPEIPLESNGWMVGFHPDSGKGRLNPRLS